jgi:AraC family transcriptional regulator
MPILHIKNMVCNRCLRVVGEELKKIDLKISQIRMGEVELLEEPSPSQLLLIRDTLLENGFELLDDKKSKLIERIKSLIINEIQLRNAQKAHNINFSTFLAESLAMDYTYLSNLFSATEGITIEKFVILQKIEKVKELLVYDELTISQIADELGYSSGQALSNQFKKITGLTPSYFKTQGQQYRKPIDRLLE